MTEKTRGKILIVDDEPLARQRIARYLREYKVEFEIAEADNGLEAVERIRAFQPEIILLDVEMPGLNGFEVLQQFENRPFHVIFQTAFDQFAIRAFEENACDYLLKPYTAGRLHESLLRVLQRMVDQERLRRLESQLGAREGGSSYLQKIIVRHTTRSRIVEARDVVCFISRDHYTCAFYKMEGGLHEGICDLSIGMLTERLDPREFVRLHRNNIACITAIRAISRSRQGAVTIELSHHLTLPISRANQKIVKALLDRSASA
jgi:two-component system, LytTR family, response regulator